MSQLYSRIVAYIKGHKIMSVVLALILIIVGYYGYKKVFASTTPTQYVLGAVERGTLISSVSGTGQVATTNQVDIKPKVSGDIISVSAQAGQKVKTGTILASINARDARKAVRDAETGLASAEIALKKASLSTDDVTKTYDDAFNSISDTFIDLPSVITDVDAIFYNSNHSPYFSDARMRDVGGDTAIDYKYKAGREFDAAKAAYLANLTDYKNISRNSDRQALLNMLSETYNTTKALTDAVKDLHSAIDFVKDRITAAEITTDISTLDSYTTKLNTHVSNLLSAKQSIQNALQGTVSNSLDIDSAKLNVQQKQNALYDAQLTLSDYTIKAPFEGVLAALNVKKGDTISSGTIVATVITDQKIATIGLNELDAAQVKVGEKATLTFDAVPDLTITGQVINIDTLGTVSQGVVTYNAKIGFDTQDNRIKPGMSVSASIITDSKPDVLMVPTSAIKTQGNTAFVQVFANKTTQETANSTNQNQTTIASKTPPQSVQVQIGSSNDTETEIVSGLSEGQEIVTRTITGSSQTTANRTAGSIFGGGARTGGGNAGFGGGGAVRVTR
jgi:RND family efflux transporter MFP subunit